MTIVTFINFDYNNRRYDSTVKLHLNKDSIVFNTRANAISWLEKHGFKSISKPDTDIWQRKTERNPDDEWNNIPYTDERAIVSNAGSDYNGQNWTYFCCEGHAE